MRILNLKIQLYASCGDIWSGELGHDFSWAATQRRSKKEVSKAYSMVQDDWTSFTGYTRDENDQGQSQEQANWDSRAPLFSEKKILDEMMDSDESEAGVVIFDKEVDSEEILDKFTDEEMKKASQSAPNRGEMLRQMKERANIFYNETKDRYSQRILEAR
jgi:hypothetical protein